MRWPISQESREARPDLEVKVTPVAWRRLTVCAMFPDGSLYGLGQTGLLDTWSMKWVFPI
jgi:hypothetical protein